jgi:hypothetical protein
MGWQDDASRRIGDLITEGGRLPLNQDGIVAFVDSPDFAGWRTRSLVALRSLLGENHTYVTEFAACTKHHYRSYRDAGLAILNALRSDIDRGHRFGGSLRDFLKMAEHLLQQGYKDPAASLCGAVLEDGLRRIARNGSINVVPRNDLNSLNTKCAQKNVYNNIVRQQITSWTSLRNSADHGNFNEYDQQQVRSMIEGVRSFLATHLS